MVDRREAVCNVSSAQKLTTRTMLVAALGPTSITLRQAGSCARPPRNTGWPVRNHDRIARFTPPCRTSSSVSQSSSASSRWIDGKVRSSRAPIVSPFRNRVSSGTGPSKAAMKAERSCASGMLDSAPPRISCSSLRCSSGGFAPAAASTCSAVLRVRASPLVTARSIFTPAAAIACAHRARLLHAAGVSGTSSGGYGRPASSKYSTAPWRISRMRRRSTCISPP
jgi:hypothetical protein